MTVEQAYELTNLAAQLGVLYVFGGIICFCIAIFFLVTSIAAAFGFLEGQRSNCMLEAYRHYRQGAYVVMRKTHRSRGWRWPHMGWSYDGVQWHEFVPFDRPMRWFPKLVFEGYVREWTWQSDRECSGNDR